MLLPAEAKQLMVAAALAFMVAGCAGGGKVTGDGVAHGGTVNVDLDGQVSPTVEVDAQVDADGNTVDLTPLP